MCEHMRLKNCLCLFLLSFREITCSCVTAQDNGSSRNKQQCIHRVITYLHLQFCDLNEYLRNKLTFFKYFQMSMKGKKVVPMQARNSY
jgi:hypothetical protein